MYEVSKNRVFQVAVNLYGGFHSVNGFFCGYVSAFCRRACEFYKVFIFAVNHAETNIAGILVVKNLHTYI